MVPNDSAPVASNCVSVFVRTRSLGEGGVLLGCARLEVVLVDVALPGCVLLGVVLLEVVLLDVVLLEASLSGMLTT